MYCEASVQYLAHPTGKASLLGNYQHSTRTVQLRLFLMVSSNTTRGNKENLEHRKLHTNVRKNLFTVSVTEHWNRIHGEVVISFSGDIQEPSRRLLV